MPNKALLTSSQWRKVKNDYVHGGITINELAAKYAVSIGAVKARCWREQWSKLRNQFETAILTPAADAPVDQNEQGKPITEAEIAEQVSLIKRHAEEDKMDLHVLLPVKREEFLRETIRTAEILLAQIKKRAQTVDLQTDAQLKSLVTALSDLVSVIKGPLALEADKPEPQKQMAVQVNILNQVLEEADKAAGRQGMRPTEEKKPEL